MDGYRHEETLSEYDFGRGHKELYAVQSQEDKRQRMHLIGFVSTHIGYI